MTFDPDQTPTFQPPEPGGEPAAPARPAPPSFIPPGIVPTMPAASRSRVSMGAVAFVAAITVAAAGLGFAGGRLTAPQAPGRTFVNGNGNGFGGFGNGNGGPNASGAPGAFGGGFGTFGGFGGTIAITGSVTAIANGSITIQQANGRSVTLTVPGTATYHAETGATATDVAVGSQVEVTVDRVGGFRGPNASAAPGASPQAAAGPGLSVSDILVLAK